MTFPHLNIGSLAHRLQSAAAQAIESQARPQSAPIQGSDSQARQQTTPGTAEHTESARQSWREATGNIVDNPETFTLFDAIHDERQAREGFEDAVRAEVAEQASQFIGPVAVPSHHIDNAASPLLQRYESDPEAYAAASAVVETMKTEASTDASPEVLELIAQARTQSDARAVLDTLAEGLPVLSETDRAYLVTSPELATLLREEIRPHVDGGLQAFMDESGDLSSGTGERLANQSAYRLAELTEGLPPELAYGVVQSNVGTIALFSELKPMLGSNPRDRAHHTDTSFWSLSRAVGAMGDAPGAQQLTADIATMYVANGFQPEFGAVVANGIADPVRKGESPALSLAVIEELQRTGQTEVAEYGVAYLMYEAELLTDSLGDELDDYQQMLGELGTLLHNHRGLPPEGVEAAVQDWLANQDEGWQQDFEAVQSRIHDRIELMAELMTGIEALPDDLLSGVENVDGRLRELFNRDDVLTAVSLVASNDRSFLEGDRGEALLGLADAAQATSTGLETLEKIGAHAVQQQVTAIFANVELGNAASVEDAKEQLRVLSGRSTAFFGADSAAYQSALAQLEAFLDLPPDATVEQVAELVADLDSRLEIDGLAANTTSGTLLRSLGVAAGALGLARNAGEAIDDPSMRNIVATLGASSGLGSGVIALLEQTGSVDVAHNASMADTRSGLRGTSLANWSRGLGVFSAVGDVAYMADALARGDGAEAGLHAMAGVGTVVMALSSGPVGAVVGAALIGLSLFGHANLAEHRGGERRYEASLDFLIAAGLEPDVAEILADRPEQGFASIPVVPLVMEDARFGRMEGYTGQELTPEEAIEALNTFSGDADKLWELRAYVNNTRYHNQHLLLEP